MLNKTMILKKLPQQLIDKIWKIMFALVLFITWGIIFIGTYSLIS